MSGGGSDDHGNGRQPKDMKGLLKFCMENTRAEDAPASGTFRELSPEVNECHVYYSYSTVYVQAHFCYNLLSCQSPNLTGIVIMQSRQRLAALLDSSAAPVLLS